MRSWQIRVIGLVLAAILGHFLIGQVRGAWRNYWLMTDGQYGMATITKPYWGGHDLYDYRYVVGGREYTAISYRDWQAPRYSNVQPGGVAVMYFSASHPWLSLLYKPHSIFEGLPVLIVVFILELFAVVTVIRPESKWAFNLSGRKTKSKAA
jgi:hypothetical protein